MCMSAYIIIKLSQVLLAQLSHSRTSLNYTHVSKLTSACQPTLLRASWDWVHVGSRTGRQLIQPNEPIALAVELLRVDEIVRNGKCAVSNAYNDESGHTCDEHDEKRERSTAPVLRGVDDRNVRGSKMRRAHHSHACAVLPPERRKSGDHEHRVQHNKAQASDRGQEHERHVWARL